MEVKMERDGWFDEKGRELFRDALVDKGEEIKAYLEDGKIDDDEINKQFRIIVDKLKAVEPKLSDDIHKEFWDILQDIYIYSEMCFCYNNPERIKTIMQYL